MVGGPGDQLGDVAAGELHRGLAALVDAVVDVGGLEPGALALEPGDEVRRQALGKDDVPLHFEVSDAFAEGEPAPVAVVDAGHCGFRCLLWVQLPGWKKRPGNSLSIAAEPGSPSGVVIFFAGKSSTRTREAR